MLSTRARVADGVVLGFAPTCNLACHAETLRELPFDESFALAAGEDRDWCARLVASGRLLHHVPDAAVVHRPQLGVAGLVRQQVRYGRGAVGFRDAGGALAGAGFYRRLARATAQAGPRTAACVALAQACGRRRRGASRRRAATRPLGPSPSTPQTAATVAATSASRGGRCGARGPCAPGTTTAQASPGVWLPERPLPVPRRRTSPKRRRVHAGQRRRGPLAPLHDEVGQLARRARRRGARRRGRRSRPPARRRDRGTSRGPSAIARSSASASAGSTIPSRSRPRRFRRM